MRRGHKNHGAFFVLSLGALLLAAGVWHFVELSRASISNTVTITATVLGCGDGIIQPGEACDGANMNSRTCITEGFTGGTISCQANCTLQTSACTGGTPRSGNVGAIGSVSSSSETFLGLAYPNSSVAILKDGQLVATVETDASGGFSSKITNLSIGTFAFGFVATDTLGNHSALTTVEITASGSSTTTRDIFLSPTIAPIGFFVSSSAVVAVTGSSAPDADVRLSITSVSGDVILTRHAQADANGEYSIQLAPNALPAGSYTVTATATLGGLTSTRSLPASFAIGAPNAPLSYLKGDYNEDGQVNLVDFSIALYWYKQPLSPAFKVLELHHGNGDGILDLVDISILAYFWTG
ncbi:MAG: hypothetical protein WC802_03390 [Patescibacteria group bacterium]|jgi:hypothetical protein